MTTNSFNDLVTSRKMLAIFLSVGMVAAFSTVAYVMAQPSSDVTSSTNSTSSTPTNPSASKMPTIQGSVNIQQQILSSATTKFSDAANTAASAVSSGVVLGGKLGIMQGYLVYNFVVLDGNGQVHYVVVDAGNGKVLFTSPGHQGSLQTLLGMNYSQHRHSYHFGYGDTTQGNMPSQDNMPTQR